MHQAWAVEAARAKSRSVRVRMAIGVRIPALASGWDTLYWSRRFRIAGQEAHDLCCPSASVFWQLSRLRTGLGKQNLSSETELLGRPF